MRGNPDQITGQCGECGRPCTDRDLVACWYWCSPCINRALDEHPITPRTVGDEFADLT